MSPPMTARRSHPHRLVPFAVLLLPVLAALPRAQQPQPAVAPAAAETPVEPVLDDQLAQRIRTEGIEHSQVMRLLRDLTGKIGHRLTGSDNFTKACDWAVAEFTAMGLQNVHREKWGEGKLLWNRGVWRGHIVAPIQLDMYVATEAWTAGTNGVRKGRVLYAPADEDGVTALLAANGGSFENVFLYEKKRPPGEVHAADGSVMTRQQLAERRDRVRALCESRGMAGWLYLAAGDAKYPKRVRVFGDNKVAMRDIQSVPTIPSIGIQSDHAEQLEKLLDEGKDVVCEFEIDNKFRAGPIELNNVIAELPGTEHPDEVIIVCGHLDSWHQAQGCTDNGTGTTSTMEAARILAAVGSKPKRTIRFCLWGGEEEGLLGSQAYVKMHRTEMHKVSCVFNHDTGTNYAASLNVSDSMYEPMRRVIVPMQKLTVPDEDHIGPAFRLSHSATISGGGGSDHASFIAAGVPGLNWNLKGRSDYFGYTWHSQWDKIDVAIEEYQRHTSTVIALAALGTANLPALLDHSGVARGGGRQAGSYAAALFDAEMDEFKFTKVEKDGRAAKMGIQVGDVLTKANGESLSAMFQIFSIARDLGEDAKTMTLELKRGDSKVEVKLDLEEVRKLSAR